GFPSIIRKRLFEVRRIRGQLGPNIPNKNGFAIDRILGVELTACIFEFAHLRWVQLASFAVGPIKPPLVRLRIIRAQSQSLDVPRRAVELNRIQLSAAIPNLEAGARAI